MRMCLTALAVFCLASTAQAGPQCTTEPQSNWISETELRSVAEEMGIEVVIFQTTSGNCYEIYGRNGDGERVEIYFHPVTAEIVRTSEG